MHSLLPLKLKIWLIVGLAALVAAIARLIGLGVLSLGVVVGIVEFLLIHLLMRSWGALQSFNWLPLPAWARVDLSGAWRGTIQSQWRSESGETPASAIAATLDLRQGWQEVVFRLRTESMHSRSSAAVPIFDAAARELQFHYFFETVPTAASSTANPPQKMGSALARVELDKPDRMSITYTNERGVGGDIVLNRMQSPTRVRRRDSPNARQSAA
jgi:SMODS-associating 2TM, beta-strand rich effector domain